MSEQNCPSEKKQRVSWRRTLGNFGSLGYCKERNTNHQKYIYNYFLSLTENATINSAPLCWKRKPVFKESYLPKDWRTSIQWICHHYSLGIRLLKTNSKQKAHFTATTRAERDGRISECWSSLAYIKKSLVDTRYQKITQ